MVDKSKRRPLEKVGMRSFITRDKRFLSTCASIGIAEIDFLVVLIVDRIVFCIVQPETRIATTVDFPGPYRLGRSFQDGHFIPVTELA